MNFTFKFSSPESIVILSFSFYKMLQVWFFFSQFHQFLGGGGSIKKDSHPLKRECKLLGVQIAVIFPGWLLVVYC